MIVMRARLAAEAADYLRLVVVWVLLAVPIAGAYDAVYEHLADERVWLLFSSEGLLLGTGAVVALELTGRRPRILSGVVFWLGYALIETAVAVGAVLVGAGGSAAHAVASVTGLAVAAWLLFGDGAEQVRATVGPAVRRLLRMPPGADGPG
jgi:hypothetical protein